MFVGFYVGDYDNSVVSIRKRSHIKSIFVNMLLQTWNLRYSKHIMIIRCVNFEPFLLSINLDVVSLFNVFSSLIYMFRYKGITVGIMAFGPASFFRRSRRIKAHRRPKYPHTNMDLNHCLKPGSWTIRSQQRPPGFIARVHPFLDGYRL